MRRHMTLALCLLLATTACSYFRPGAKLETKEAVKAAIDAHLAKRRGQLALAQMNVEVKDVKFAGDRAEADVLFTTQGGASMAMHYSLRREGDHWVVERSGSSGTGMPPGHPPTSESAPPPGEMPRGQPR